MSIDDQHSEMVVVQIEDSREEVSKRNTHVGGTIAQDTLISVVRPRDNISFHCSCVALG